MRALRLAPPFVKGDRVVLLRMANDPDPITPGTKGTVESVADFGNGQFQLNMAWDNGRTLGICWPEDRVEKVKS